MCSWLLFTTGSISNSVHFDVSRSDLSDAVEAIEVVEPVVADGVLATASDKIKEVGACTVPLWKIVDWLRRRV